MTTTIRQATPDLLTATHQMFGKITDKMLEASIDQWNHDYPDIETLTNDVESGNQYVALVDGNLAGSIVLDARQDPQYRNIHWHQLNHKVLVIHRLGVDPQYQGLGIGKQLCLFAEEYGKQNGYLSIRLDAYAGNPISNAMYDKLGYDKAGGYCYFRKKAIPFYCYDKTLVG